MKNNSERVPNKNFKLLNNRPLYKWVLDSLLMVERIDKIIINTDAEKKFQKLKNNPKIVIKKRKDKICGDFVSMNEIIKDDLNDFNADIFIMTHTTNPFLSSETINECLDKFLESTNDSLFTVNKLQTRFYDKGAKPINHSVTKLLRTQDLDPYFEENSCLYIFTSKSFNKTNNRIGEFPLMYEMKKKEALDIDDSEDWELAEIFANEKK